jgi:hypothetical protein
LLDPIFKAIVEEALVAGSASRGRSSNTKLRAIACFAMAIGLILIRRLSRPV